MKYKYKVMAFFRFPSDEAKEVNLAEDKDLQNDIEKAAEVFNENNAGKAISDIQYFKNVFQFTFSCLYEVRSVGHELATFSRYLYHDMGWKRFSKEPTKLFRFKYEEINGSNGADERADEKLSVASIFVNHGTKTIYIPEQFRDYEIKFL